MNFNGKLKSAMRAYTVIRSELMTGIREPEYGMDN